MSGNIRIEIIRRAILDLVEDTGGEINDEVIALGLNEIGHLVGRAEAATQMRWLANEGLLHVQELAEFLIARSTVNGRDVARGLLRYPGVYRHKTGE